MRDRIFAFLFCFIALLAHTLTPAYAWSNGGFSSDPLKPDYGTHDWIAEHALDWLPSDAKEWIAANLPWYLYGTELPDNGQAPDGIGDTSLHHIYFDSKGKLIDGAAAFRANATYQEALGFLLSGNLTMAAKYAGAMSHYIADMAVFGHVMGSGTDWGAEIHHSDYETYVNSKTSSYKAEFNSYLSFDGSLAILSAYEAALKLAYDTTFDSSGRGLTCVWMDRNYDWSNRTFRNRVGESLNLAVNYLADVLYTLYMEFRSKKQTEPMGVVTFSVEGIGKDALGTILVIDGVGYNLSSLPISFLWEAGSSHSFEWMASVGVGSEKRYVWNSTMGLSNLRADSIIVLPGIKASIQASYKAQYLWTFSVEGIGKDALGTILVIDGVGYDSHALGYDAAYDSPKPKLLASFWWEEGSNHTFSYEAYVASKIEGKRYAIRDPPRLKVTISGPGNLSPLYHAEYELKIGILAAGGKTDPPPGSHWLDDGSNVTLEAIEDQGYRFDGWIGSYNSTNKQLCISISGAPAFVNAKFSRVFDFIIFVDPRNGTVRKGVSISLQARIETILLSGTSQPIDITISGLPPGTSYLLNASSGLPPFTSLLNITIGPSTPAGTYCITVRGMGGGLNKTATYVLTVLEPEGMLLDQPCLSLAMLIVLAFGIVATVLVIVLIKRK
ncbi:MAG: zinc dependent phospholipase C family protein [Candidatus Bathyarchaeia archaeon]